jgi:hypothetical protein
MGLECATYSTPPSTKYQRSNPPSQIAILKKNGSLDSGIQAWYLSTRHVATRENFWQQYTLIAHWLLNTMMMIEWYEAGHANYYPGGTDTHV